MVLSLAIPKKEEKTPKVWYTFGVLVSSNMDLSYRFAYWHYSICENQMQYALINFAYCLK